MLKAYHRGDGAQGYVKAGEQVVRLGYQIDQCNNIKEYAMAAYFRPCCLYRIEDVNSRTDQNDEQIGGNSPPVIPYIPNDKIRHYNHKISHDIEYHKKRDKGYISFKAQL